MVYHLNGASWCGNTLMWKLEVIHLYIVETWMETTRTICSKCFYPFVKQLLSCSLSTNFVLHPAEVHLFDAFCKTLFCLILKIEYPRCSFARIAAQLCSQTQRAWKQMRFCFQTKQLLKHDSCYLTFSYWMTKTIISYKFFFYFSF